MTQVYHKSKTEIVFPSGRVVDIETRYRDITPTEAKEKEITVAANSTVTIWDKSSTSENIDTLTFCQIVNTGSNTIHVELVVDDGGENGEEFNTVAIPSKGHHILFSGSSYANHSTGDSFAGILGVIERIRVKEPNGVLANLTFAIAGVT